MKLARIRTEEYTAYPQLLGSGSLQISMLINPEQEIVRSIERLLTLPGAVEYGQLADGFIRMVGMRVESGPLIEQPLTRFREIVQDDGIMVGGHRPWPEAHRPFRLRRHQGGGHRLFRLQAHQPAGTAAGAAQDAGQPRHGLHRGRRGTSACVWRGS